MHLCPLAEPHGMADEELSKRDEQAQGSRPMCALWLADGACRWRYSDRFVLSEDSVSMGLALLFIGRP